jgi:hypothetical protein
MPATGCAAYKRPWSSSVIASDDVVLGQGARVVATMAPDLDVFAVVTRQAVLRADPDEAVAVRVDRAYRIRRQPAIDIQRVEARAVRDQGCRRRTGTQPSHQPQTDPARRAPFHAVDCRAPARAGQAAGRLTCVMPELPEVETTRRGIAPHARVARDTAPVLRRPDLRWPIAREIRTTFCVGQRVSHTVRRRAKYLLLDSAPAAARSCISACPGRCACSTATCRYGRTTMSTSSSTTAACCASTIRAVSAACSGSRRTRRTNCCAISAPNPWATPSTATTCSRKVAGAARR